MPSSYSEIHNRLVKLNWLYIRSFLFFDDRQENYNAISKKHFHLQLF